jgi:hypothetical protein
MSTLPPPSRETEQCAAPGAPGDSPAYPETWLWGEHGEVCSGTFVRFDKAPTREYGNKLILILAVDGRERSIWLLQTALKQRIRDELRDRSDRRLAVGERVAIHRLAETTTQDGKRSYRPFRIYFADRPELDLDREFELDAPVPRSRPDPERAIEPKATTGSPDALADDIPF